MSDPYAPGEREETVYAVDNVPLDLPIARVGSRVLAAVVDYLILTAATFAVWMVTLAVGVALSLRGGWVVALVVIAYFLLEHGYFMLSEILMNGQTAGKRIFRLQVVAAEGSRASTSALVVRNLLRTIDLLVGVILMAVDPLARRLGDRIGGTRVIHRSRLEGSGPSLLFPPDWKGEEIRVVEGFFARLGDLEPGARGRIARRLERYVEGRAPGLLTGAPSGDPTARLLAAFTPDSA